MKKLTLLILLSLATGCKKTCPNPTPEPTKIQLFVLAGQSNMTGYPPYNQQVSNDPRLMLLNDPLNGPAMAFARAYLANHPSRRIALYQFAVGGTGIDLWTPINGNGGLFSPMLNSVRNFMSGNSQDYDLAGVLFYQGECDASPYCTNRVLTWDVYFLDMVKELREGLNSPALPVIFAQLGTNDDPTYDRWDEIKRQQADIKQAQVYMIKTEDLGRRDIVHLSEASEEVVGQRYANGYDSLTSYGGECTESFLGLSY